MYQYLDHDNLNHIFLIHAFSDTKSLIWLFCIGKTFVETMYFSLMSNSLHLFCFLLYSFPFCAFLLIFYFDLHKATRLGQIIPIYLSSIFFECKCLPCLLYLYYSFLSSFPFSSLSSFFFLFSLFIQHCFCLMLRPYNQNIMS